MGRRGAADDDRGTIRARLGAASGRKFWRSLEELADSADFRRQLEAEFPSLAPLMSEASRRDVLRVMGASLALAGLTGCGIPEAEKSVPYVEAPEFLVPGQPRSYATATLLDGYAMPVLVKTVDGRPIKAEGNPDHPVSRGATDIFSQAAVLDLYDPDRSSATLYDGRIASFDAFRLALDERAAGLAQKQGRGLAILTGALTSPTTIRQMQQLQHRFAELRWYVHEPLGQDRHYAATKLAFGAPFEVRYRLDRADVVLALDADPLGPGPAQLVYAGQWAGRRRSEFAGGRLPDLYVLETTPSLTGARATSRIPASSAEIINFTLGLAQQLGLGPAAAPDLSLAGRARLQPVADALKRAGPDGLILPGSHLPPQVQALALTLNDRLGSIGRTLEVSAPVEALAERQGHSLADLAAAIDARRDRHAGHPRCQSGLHGARRPRLRRAAATGAAARARRRPRRRDRSALPLARAARPSVRDLERRARGRRHGERAAAAGAALVRRPLDPRGAGDARGRPPRGGL